MADSPAPEKVTVSRAALVQLLNAFAGPMYLVNELHAIQKFESCPVYILRKEVQAND